jgi:thiamine-monophosphate kinase
VTGTPLGPGGEFDTIREMLARWGTVARDIGDDAALVDVPAGSRLVVSTDTSVENVHFRGATLAPEEIAYRAVAAAMSDLAAMAATPLGIVVALTLTDAWRAAVPALADGIAAASRALGAPILGGDVTRGGELAIGVTVLGSVEHPLLRSGARAGDTLWVTGHLGGALLAFRALESGAAPDPAQRAKFAHPEPRLREARWLAAHGATAGIDCSDGIAADASHVAAASGVRIVLDLDRLPLAKGATPQDAAASGEEYELIVTAPSALDRAAFEREFDIPVTAVGRVEAIGAGAGGVETYSGGVRVPLPRGHSHFSA